MPSCTVKFMTPLLFAGRGLSNFWRRSKPVCGAVHSSISASAAGHQPSPQQPRPGAAWQRFPEVDLAVNNLVDNRPAARKRLSKRRPRTTGCPQATRATSLSRAAGRSPTSSARRREGSDLLLAPPGGPPPPPRAAGGPRPPPRAAGRSPTSSARRREGPDLLLAPPGGPPPPAAPLRPAPPRPIFYLGRCLTSPPHLLILPALGSPAPTSSFVAAPSPRPTFFLFIGDN
nr:uncharacterized protein LOC127331688 [Lolium perenne]